MHSYVHVLKCFENLVLEVRIGWSSQFLAFSLSLLKLMHLHTFFRSPSKLTIMSNNQSQRPMTSVFEACSNSNKQKTFADNAANTKSSSLRNQARDFSMLGKPAAGAGASTGSAASCPPAAKRYKQAHDQVRNSFEEQKNERDVLLCNDELLNRSVHTPAAAVASSKLLIVNFLGCCKGERHHFSPLFCASKNVCVLCLCPYDAL